MTTCIAFSWLYSVYLCLFLIHQPNFFIISPKKYIDVSIYLSIYLFTCLFISLMVLHNWSTWYIYIFTSYYTNITYVFKSNPVNYLHYLFNDVAIIIVLPIIIGYLNDDSHVNNNEVNIKKKFSWKYSNITHTPRFCVYLYFP